MSNRHNIEVDDDNEVYRHFEFHPDVYPPVMEEGDFFTPEEEARLDAWLAKREVSRVKRFAGRSWRSDRYNLGYHVEYKDRRR